MKDSKKAKKAHLLSDNLLEYGILVRLPAKVLLRLQCVSRKWHTLISGNLSFIHRQSRHAPSGIVSMDMEGVDTPLRFVSEHPRSVGIPSYSARGYILASCKGIICYRSYSNIFMGNLSLDDWGLCSLHDRPFAVGSSVYGLAIDAEVESVALYKLVAVYSKHRTKFRTREYEFTVLSSRTPQWQVSKGGSIVLPSSKRVGKAAVYAKGTLYWKFGRRELLWFDPQADRSGLRELPFGWESERGVVGELKGDLGFAMGTACGVEIWSMSADSLWSRKYSVSWGQIVGGLQLCPAVQFHPFEGDVVFFSLPDGRTYCYEMAKGEVRSRARQCGVACDWFPYRSSLVSLSKYTQT